MFVLDLQAVLKFGPFSTWHMRTLNFVTLFQLHVFILRITVHMFSIFHWLQLQSAPLNFFIVLYVHIYLYIYIYMYFTLTAADQRYAQTTFLRTHKVRCYNSCPGTVASNFTWCANIFHPTRKIEMCLNSTGENDTADANTAGILSHFSMPEVWETKTSRRNISASVHSILYSILANKSSVFLYVVL